MSSLFRDKEYDKLDWISQAVEPFVTEYSAILESIPNKIELSDKDIIDLLLDGSTSFPVTMFIGPLITNHATYISNNNYTIKRLICDKFSFETSGQITANLASGAVEGKAWITKISETFSEDEIKHIMELEYGAATGRHGLDLIKQRVTEVGAILLPADHVFFDKKSELRKYEALIRYTAKAISNDDYRFRSTKASRDFGELIAKYVTGGPESLLGMIYRIKMMIDRKHPIYSVEM